MKLAVLKETKQRKAGNVMSLKVKHGLTKQCTPWYQVNGKFVSKETWVYAVQDNAINKKLDREALQAKLIIALFAAELIGMIVLVTQNIALW